MKRLVQARKSLGSSTFAVERRAGAIRPRIQKRRECEAEERKRRREEKRRELQQLELELAAAVRKGHKESSIRRIENRRVDKVALRWGVRKA